VTGRKHCRTTAPLVERWGIDLGSERCGERPAEMGQVLRLGSETSKWVELPWEMWCSRRRWRSELPGGCSKHPGIPHFVQRQRRSFLGCSGGIRSALEAAVVASRKCRAPSGVGPSLDGTWRS
jgi:hypothetical protein